MAPPNGPGESVPKNITPLEIKVEAPLPKQNETPDEKKMREEREKEERERVDRETKERLDSAKRTGEVERNLETTPEKKVKPGEEKPEVEADDSPKTWTDKLMKGAEKAMGMLQQFKEMLQSFGAEMLKTFAALARMVGWNDVAKYLEDLASNDASELAAALKKNGVPLKKLKRPAKDEDPDVLKEQMTAFEAEKAKMEAPQAALASRYEELASADKRGTAYTRQKFYAEVVGKWKKGRGDVKECGADELEQIAKIANDKQQVPDTDGPPKNLPKTPEQVNAVALETLTSDKNILNAPVDVSINGGASFRIQIVGDRIDIGGKTYAIERKLTSQEKSDFKTDKDKIRLQNITTANLNANGLVLAAKGEVQKTGSPVEIKEIPVTVTKKELEDLPSKFANLITNSFEIGNLNFVKAL